MQVLLYLIKVWRYHIFNKNANTVSDTSLHLNIDTKCGIIQWAKVYTQPRDDESFFVMLPDGTCNTENTNDHEKITECGRFVIVRLP